MSNRSYILKFFYLIERVSISVQIQANPDNFRIERPYVGLG